MKRLLLLRHAKSSWKDSELDDHDRPLNGRGRRDAPRMGRVLREQGLVPRAIVTSTAARARTTAAEVARAAGCEGRVIATERLYTATTADCLDVVREMGADADPLMIVGHNPTFEELVEQLTSEETRMPTAAIAVVGFTLDGDWSTLPAHPAGHLLAIWRPKELDEVTRD